MINSASRCASTHRSLLDDLVRSEQRQKRLLPKEDKDDGLDGEELEYGAVRLELRCDGQVDLYDGVKRNGD